MLRLLSLFSTLLVGLTLGSSASAQKAGDFDYYLLALSWSPSYCADDGKKGRDKLQCYSDRRYGFVVHGLWPQYDKGYPEYCDTSFKKPSRKLVDQMLKFSPSRGLIHHEWKKHGTCTGLSSLEYFRLAVKSFKKLKRPESLVSLDRPILKTVRQIRNDLLEANPNIPSDGIVVTCKRQKLREIRICMDKQGNYKSCSRSALRGMCRNKDKLRILSAR
ncbi:ribonuclease T2 family protein [Cohaesibacter gelatinilyticus]|uniref:Ribonuclease T2 n=1 Tax=Cohaesibacter gelatinilyticus TaxID=372072 RepID=A0A285PHG3_9HYPH|nr:ribonuclease T2 [Cohaesibacter gelatinilyticus]SNZ20858.1 ribonuclease T2 [Cohaesibacter gelatinilyticus]HAT86802.1 ribonuclease T [Hyphomicrobiales bacterium]